MTTINDIEKRIGEASEWTPLNKEDLTIILGKQQMRDLKGMIIPYPVIESTMDSVLEICWVIPKDIKY